MNIELDHFFILVEPGAKTADRLLDLGLKESFSRIHKGQGTTNRRFAFSNSLLEFLWVHDEQEANTGPARDLNFLTRVTDLSASPFGIVLYRKDNNHPGMPFPGWSYQPEYFEPPWAFHIGENAKKLEEPLCIYVPFLEPIARQSEPGRFRTIHKVTIHTHATPLSNTIECVNKADRIEIIHGDRHLMEIRFENSQGEIHDFQPELPLIIYG